MTVLRSVLVLIPRSPLYLVIVVYACDDCCKYIFSVKCCGGGCSSPRKENHSKTPKGKYVVPHERET